MLIQLQTIHFSYNEISVLSNLTASFDTGWTAIAGINGAGKSTLLQLACGLITPQSGTVTKNRNAIYCEQRTDKIPAMFNLLQDDYSSSSWKLKDGLHIEYDWHLRWDTLSHGERKRAQIATALYLEPDLLAIDEPCNHLDKVYQQMVADALSHYKGVGLIVSHNKELLDLLSYQTLFLENGAIRVRKGNYSHAVSELIQEDKNEHKEKLQLTKKIKQLSKQALTQRVKAKSADKMRTKKGVDKKDHDAKAKKNLARLTGKDATAGKIHKRLDNRIDSLKEKASALQSYHEHAIQYCIPASYSHKRFVVTIAEGSLPIGSKRLYYPDLALKRGEVVQLAGTNGSGKSSFIRRLLREIKSKDTLYIPQEISAFESQQFKQKMLELDPKSKGKVFTTVGSLGSDPKRLLSTPLPSPGELRKLMFAYGILSEVELIIMDEPTNHLDLASKDALKLALANCPVSQILVSHEHEFSSGLATKIWQIESGEKSNTLKELLL